MSEDQVSTHKSTYLTSDFLELESLSTTSPTQLLLSAPAAVAVSPSLTSSSELSALLLLAVRFLFGYLGSEMQKRLRATRSENKMENPYNGWTVGNSG